MRTSYLLITLLILPLVAAPVLAENEIRSDLCEASAAVTIVGSWVRPPIIPGRPAAGYLTVCNGSSVDDRLLSVESPDATRVEIHETQNHDGIMKMQPVEFVAVAAGEQQGLLPGKRHLMIFGLSADVGSHVRLQLRFERAGLIEVHAPLTTDPTAHNH